MISFLVNWKIIVKNLKQSSNTEMYAIKSKRYKMRPIKLVRLTKPLKHNIKTSKSQLINTYFHNSLEKNKFSGSKIDTNQGCWSSNIEIRF